MGVKELIYRKGGKPKISTSEINSVVSEEGLLYTMEQEFFNSKDFKDRHLAKLWDKTSEMAEEIYEILNESEYEDDDDDDNYAKGGKTDISYFDLKEKSFTTKELKKMGFIGPIVSFVNYEKDADAHTYVKDKYAYDFYELPNGKLKAYDRYTYEHMEQEIGYHYDPILKKAIPMGKEWYNKDKPLKSDLYEKNKEYSLAVNSKYPHIGRENIPDEEGGKEFLHFFYGKLLKHGWKNFSELAERKWGDGSSEEYTLNDILAGNYYEDQDIPDLYKIAKFAKEKGENQLAESIYYYLKLKGHKIPYRKEHGGYSDSEDGGRYEKTIY